MRGLTLWQPWGTCVSRWGKRIENRPWKPWDSIIGQVIAIHAGKKMDDECLNKLYRNETPAGLITLSRRDFPRGAIIGVATVAGCVTESSDPWFFGPFGWILKDVRELAEPIPARGMQGLWPIPPALEAMIRDQLALDTGVNSQ